MQAPPAAQHPLPLVSILVMGHNQEAYIGECIDSLFAQNYQGPVEIVLCDDCSTDGTFAVMQRKAAEYKGPFSIIAHRCPVNGGVATNMNTAVSLSHGDWLMRVDGDDVMHPDRLRLSMLALMSHPDAVGVSGQFRLFSDTYEPVENPPDAELEYFSCTRQDFHPNKPDQLQWWGGIMTFSRRLFTEFGDMPAGCNVLDDTLFMTRALMLGRFVIVRNATFIYYRRHGGNVSSTYGQTQSLWQRYRDDLNTRAYYRKGIPCHELIMPELRTRAGQDATCVALARFFERHFAEMRRQALFWDKSWSARIADAYIAGPWWRKIPWAIRVICPATYALGAWLRSLGKR